MEYNALYSYELGGETVDAENRFQYLERLEKLRNSKVLVYFRIRLWMTVSWFPSISSSKRLGIRAKLI